MQRNAHANVLVIVVSRIASDETQTCPALVGVSPRRETKDIVLCYMMMISKYLKIIVSNLTTNEFSQLSKVL